MKVEERRGAPVVVGDATLVPVERVVAWRVEGPGGAFLYVEKACVAVEVRTARGAEVVDLTRAPS